MNTPAVNRELTDSPAYAIGIDIGGTKISGGIVAFPSLQILGGRRIPTGCTRDPEAILNDTLQMARDLLDLANQNGLSITGLGLAVPELIDLAGNVTSDYNFDWRHLAIREIFGALAPTLVESDIRVAALAEARYGAGAKLRTFAYIGVGTGIGSCLVLDGQPYKGATGSALTFASSPLSTTCDCCGAELKPVLDRIAAGPALVLRYNTLSGGAVESAEQVLAAATTGDPLALHVIRSAGRALGVSTAFMINILDPEAVVVGGGVGLAGGLYWEAFVQSVREHVWSEINRDLPLLPAALGTHAGVVGAAVAAREGLVT